MKNISVNYEVERGVPIPVGRGYGLSATLRNMEVGESFLVMKGKIKSVRGVVTHISQENREKKFVTRDMNDGTVRIWRKK